MEIEEWSCRLECVMSMLEILSEVNTYSPGKTQTAKSVMKLTVYRVEVDRKKCIACGTCYSSSSVFFEPDGAGYARVVGGKTDELRSFKVFNDENMETASSTAGYCPASAITVTEGEGPEGK